MSVSEFERRGWGQELCSFFSFDLTVDIIFIWQLKALGIASLILTLTLGFINNLELMRTSYNLVLFRSRLRRSHHFQAYRSLSVAFLKPDHHPPAIIPSHSLFLLHGFNAHHRSAYFSFLLFLLCLSYLILPPLSLLGFFTRAKPATNIEFNDRHRSLLFFI